MGGAFATHAQSTKGSKMWEESSKSGKKGRPTVADNMLLGSRNAWRSFFQQYWPEIGCRLLAIRDKRASTVDDVRVAMKAVKGRLNSDIARVFWSGSPKPATLREIHDNRIESSALHFTAQKMHVGIADLCRACRDAEVALEQATPELLETLGAETQRRNELLSETERKLIEDESRCRELDELINDQECYWYCAELLDFLRSRRYAVEPDNLSHALAGVSSMKWRQSFARCSKLPEELYVQFPYSVFRTISRIWDRRREEFEVAPVKFFRTELLKLRKSDWDAKERLCQDFRDLRLALEKCWHSKRSSTCVPFAISLAFLENIQHNKTSVDRVLDSQENLIPNQESGTKPSRR